MVWAIGGRPYQTLSEREQQQVIDDFDENIRRGAYKKGNKRSVVVGVIIKIQSQIASITQYLIKKIPSTAKPMILVSRVGMSRIW